MNGLVAVSVCFYAPLCSPLSFDKNIQHSFRKIKALAHHAELPTSGGRETESERENHPNGDSAFFSPERGDGSIHKLHPQQGLAAGGAGLGGQPTEGSPPGTGHRRRGHGTARHEPSHAPAAGHAERRHAQRQLRARQLQVPLPVCILVTRRGQEFFFI